MKFKLSLCAYACITGCALEAPVAVSETGPSARPTWNEFRSRPPLTWEEFRATVAREPFAPYRFIVDGDITLSDEGQLWQHYQAWLLQEYAELEAGGSALTVRRVLGADVIWSGAQKNRLTYCISDDFNDRKAQVVTAMRRATHSWSDRVAILFLYQPEQDATCDNANTNVLFDVRPVEASYIANSFSPDKVRAERELLITDVAFTTRAGGRDFEGILRHETGHILGFRHEHITMNNCTGEPSSEGRVVNSYDVNSVMHYPECRPGGSGGYRQTELDFSGASSLYGEAEAASPIVDPDEKFDLDGDRKADICGRAGGGIHCALSTGASFEPFRPWAPLFSDAHGWNTAVYYSTIHFPDVNGDRRADVCGRAPDGIYCALNVGSSFGPPTRWAATFTDSDGWNAPEYNSTIRFPDVNNDGRADICGRAVGGVYCALSTGASFGHLDPWAAGFSDHNGWTAPAYYSTIRFPDLNNDGRADVCGRAAGGIYCALSTGTTFGPLAPWAPAYSDAAGWDVGPDYYATIRFPDLNNDGRADVCGRDVGGVYCALGTGMSFGPVSLWAAGYSDTAGWSTPAYYSTIQFADIDGDHRADVCGRGGDGISCAVSSGTSFGPLRQWTSNYSDVFGWNTSPAYYSTIRLTDVTGDGRADVCGRGAGGMYCVPSLGTSFGPLVLWTSDFSDTQGWSGGPEYYSTIRLP